MSLKYLILTAVITGLAGFVFFSWNGGNSSVTKADIVEICGNIDDERLQLQCWDDEFRAVLKSHGLNKAYDLLADIYQQEPGFARDCHPITHSIGQEAYQEFKKKGKFAVSSRTSYCGFGFFHGFMEALFADGRDVNMAREVCEYMDKQVMTGGLSCFHGIGHGVADGSDRRAWGDEHEFLKPALELCDKIAFTELEQYRCSSGAFNSLSIAYVSNLFGMEIDGRDPLWICREQDDKYKLGCYTDMMVAIVKLADDDIVKSAEYLKDVEDAYALESARSISGLGVRDRLHDSDYGDIVDSCNRIASRLRDDCIGGFANSLMEFGEPGRNYVKAVSFCELPGMSDSARRNCFSSVLGYAAIEYPREKMREICFMVPETYKISVCNF